MEVAHLQAQMKEKAQKFLVLVTDLLTREYSSRDLALLFLLALLCGASIKSLVNDTLTIGFDDYTLSRNQGLVDLNALEKRLINNGGTVATATAAPPKGEVCSVDNQ